MNKKRTPNPSRSILELQQRLRELEKASRIEFATFTKKEKDILFKTVKLSEEVGELSNDILSILSLQRKTKLKTFNKLNLYEEFADVVISVTKLANTLGVDLSRALRGKIKKIEEEYARHN